MADDEERGDALATLEAIREGGEKVVAIAQERLRAAQMALADGLFDQAEDRVSEAAHWVRFLGLAERSLKSYATGVRMVPAEDLAEGMVVHGYGEVVSVEPSRGPLGAARLRVTVMNPDGGEETTMVPLDKPVVVEAEQ